GVVTARELLAAEPTDRVEELIERDPVTVSPNDTARVAAHKMAEHDVGRLVVVSGGVPCGIVTRSDLLGVFAKGSR
ncbi:MAG: CBS domain-containing protein, partial [Deltaproteobacteria bacterium]|nr:CBS domain-containing protein [Deltaproteobacteria bacterium]